jgi:DNA-binding CsgD family transcriptional regulator
MKELSLNGQSPDRLTDCETTNELATNILNEINAFVFVFDVQNIKPLWINRYFTERMGYTNQDIRNTSKEDFLKLFHPNSLALLISRIEFFTKNTNKEIRTVYQLKTKNQEWIRLLTSSRVFKRNTDGSVKYLVGYAYEVSTQELKRNLNEVTGLKQKVDNLSLVSSLSRREFDIIRFISRGFTDKEISKKLNISIHTTKTHRKRIIQKLEVKNTAALVKFSVENDLC